MVRKLWEYTINVQVFDLWAVCIAAQWGGEQLIPA